MAWFLSFIFRGSGAGGVLPCFFGHGSKSAGWSFGIHTVRGHTAGNVHHPRLHRLYRRQTHPEHRQTGERLMSVEK